MRITDLLDVRSVMLGAAPSDKKQTLEQAVALMIKSGKIADEEAYKRQVFAREEESTTGIGEGIAIPHGKCDAVTKPGLAAMVIPGGVDFESLDDEPVTLLFLIAAPNTKDNVHLDVLSKLSVMLMDEEFTAALRAAKSVDEFMQIVDDAEVLVVHQLPRKAYRRDGRDHRQEIRRLEYRGKTQLLIQQIRDNHGDAGRNRHDQNHIFECVADGLRELGVAQNRLIIGKPPLIEAAGQVAVSLFEVHQHDVNHGVERKDGDTD